MLIATVVVSALRKAPDSKNDVSPVHSFQWCKETTAHYSINVEKL